MSYAVGPIALVALRKSLPNHKRTFKVPFARFTCFIAYYICNLLVYWTGWNVIWKVLVFILVGVTSLIISKKFFQKNSLLHTKNALWLILHFLGIAAASYLGSFGGGKSIIPFGWDFLCIAIFSLIVFFISEKSAFKKALKIKA